MLADLIDAVVGVDTHRDTHHVEIALPTGTPIATCSITNDASGYAQLLAWILEHAPGPRIVVSIEGTRSYGIGLARAVTAAGLLVLECEQPHRKTRRGKGKSDPIDAHLAVLSALRLDTDQLPIPRADGDREALRILLGARHELTVTSTAQINRLRALLRDAHDDTDRQLARAALTDATPHPPGPPSPVRAMPAANRPSATPRSAASPWPSTTPAAHSKTTAPNCSPSSTTSPPVSPNAPASAPSPPPRPSWRSPIPAAAATTPRSPPSPAPARIPASSGHTVRHRLNRGGDRALNRAIHTIATVRMRDCPDHPGLHRPAHRRRQDHPRDQTLPQAIHHPPALPHPHRHHDTHHQQPGGRLTHIQASTSTRRRPETADQTPWPGSGT